jgi:hypothetical protein
MTENSFIQHSLANEDLRDYEGFSNFLSQLDQPTDRGTEQSLTLPPASAVSASPAREDQAAQQASFEALLQHDSEIADLAHHLQEILDERRLRISLPSLFPSLDVPSTEGSGGS